MNVAVMVTFPNKKKGFKISIRNFNKGNLVLNKVDEKTKSKFRFRFREFFYSILDLKTLFRSKNKVLNEGNLVKFSPE
jgi:hypothetical protein